MGEVSGVEKMVVQIVTKENILPTAPTPDALKIFKLSVLDQTQVELYVPLMLFYLNNNTGNLDSVISDKSKLLKQSLSETLTRYYPFAGKVRDDFHIDCNDEGVYYIETRVNCSLLDFLGQSPGDELVNRLVPEEARESPMGNYILIIQANIFSCGGIALCTCISHKFLDGTTYTLFLKDWTSAARGSSSEIVNPNFSVPSLFPQIPSLSFKNPMSFSKIKFASQRFVFDGPKIAALKAKTKLLSSGSESSRFEVVAALLWKCVAKAACKSNKSSLGDPLNMGVFMNLRGKKCLLKNSVGNLVWPALAQCKLSPELEHKTLVDEIKKCKAGISDDFVEAIKGDAGTPTLVKIAEMMTSGEISFSLWITSMCNMGLYQLDFGWGKPVWFYFCNLKLVNFISLCDAGAGGGIQAIVSLSEEEMTFFENDPELLAFASVNPALL
ncbi:Transferase, Chloramphenicol acetyltransferase-like domain protein [Heracleum sosnowskyi]|uniref:Transferase, Chloramphenicol acetyltransferase-like domain protein n=1 Tax=Heracleum sosnowskyi TaxID=360622 RepID=A0AAD8IV34_9APIA|nr:Transferase, Chloramphenicol acetyltransferase-like domain protein [Heracleum sosnowskyi]